MRMTMEFSVQNIVEIQKKLLESVERMRRRMTEGVKMEITHGLHREKDKRSARQHNKLQSIPGLRSDTTGNYALTFALKAFKRLNESETHQANDDDFN